MKKMLQERERILDKNIVNVMGYLYDSRGFAPENVCAFLQRMYGALTEDEFSSRLSKNEYICILYYIAKCGFDAEVERKVLEAVKNSDEALSELISKKLYLKDFFEVYENAQGFRAENKPLLEELQLSGVIDAIPHVNEEYRTDYNHSCRKLFNRQIRAVGGAAMFD